MPRLGSRKRAAAAAAEASRKVPRTGSQPGAYGGVASTSPLVAVARARDVRPVVAPAPFDDDDDVHVPRKRRSRPSTSRAVPTDTEDPRIVELQRRWRAVLEWEVGRSSSCALSRVLRTFRACMLLLNTVGITCPRPRLAWGAQRYC